MADDPKPFVFPTTGRLPHRDASAGIAFQSGGNRGAYQAGIVHALVLSGYYPRTIGGTSVGSLSGAVLALAAEEEDQGRRMKLAGDYLAAWEKRPGEEAMALLRKGPAGDLARDLAEIDLPLGTLLHLVGEVLGQRPVAFKVLAGLRLWAALPVKLKARVFSALGAQLPNLDRLDVRGLRAAQEVLDAYGLKTSLLAQAPITHWFGKLLDEHAPKGRETTFSDLERSDLVFQIANVSPTPGQRRRVLTVGRRLRSPGPDTLAGGRLLAALDASSSFAPFFAPRRLGDIVESPADLPDPALSPDDLVMDAADIEKDALAPVLDRWTRADGDGEYRLFAAYHSPLGPTEGDHDSPFLGPALRSLELRDDLDLGYNADVITLITGMIERIDEAGLPRPERGGGRRYTRVRTSAIAPRRLLPLAEIGVPEEGEVLEAAALGCRGALEALHEQTIKALGGGEPVACARVLAAVRDAQEDKSAGYFEPLPRLCGACERELSPVFRPKRNATKAVEDANAFPPIAVPPPDHRRQLTIVVPAGGVFLGVFQFGAIAALKQYDIHPDLYAGASVGTIFSYLLQAMLSGGTMDRVVSLAETLPDWVDLGPDDKKRVDTVVDEVRERWGRPEMESLRALRPRQIVDLLLAEGSADDPTWKVLHAGLDALFFTPMPGLDLGPEYHLDVGERGELRRTLADLIQNRLPAVVRRVGGRESLLDRIAANLGLYHPASPEEGEVVGFVGIQKHLEEIAFQGEDSAQVRLSTYSNEEKKVRFVFTVTNHDRGLVEYLGYDDGVEPQLGSPFAVQAALAASSFPLAFRRRRRSEIFGPTGQPDDLYADGGIFNNFPSDTAFAYLRDLSDRTATRWIGEERHQMLLLSLTSPSLSDGALDHDRGIVALTLRSLSLSESEKVSKTLKSQELLNAVAAIANPLHRERRERQTIRTEMELISPTYTIYPHAFALKPYLGFTVEKEREMLASGCRRARMAIEWGKYQDRHPVSSAAALDVLRERFRTELKGEVASDHGAMNCVFGRFGPPPYPVPCPFAGGTMDPVHQMCRKTVDKELDVPDLKLSRRLFPQQRKV